MLKFIFWSLLAINAVLFAYGRGLLGNFRTSEREPARLARQFNTDKLQLLAGGKAVPAAPPVAAATAAPVAEAVEAPAAPEPDQADPVVMVACTQVGNFAAAEARRFDKLIEPLGLSGKQLAQEEVQSQEITSHMVMIPPLGSKEAADKKAAELKEQGVTNYFIMNDATPARWAISLGVFKSEAAAQTLLAALNKQGVTGAKIAGRSTSTTRTLYRLRNIDAATRNKVDAIAGRFAGVDTRSCK